MFIFSTCATFKFIFHNTYSQKKTCDGKLNVVKINTLNRGNTFQDFPSTCGILWFKIRENGGTNVEINACDWKALKKLFKLCIFVFLIHGSNKFFQRKLIVNYDKNLKPNFKIKCNRVKVSLGGTIRNHLKEWKKNQK
jgi:hypothetical protein